MKQAADQWLVSIFSLKRLGSGKQNKAPFKCQAKEKLNSDF